MKKFLIILLSLTLISGTLFAVSGHGGVKLGPSLAWDCDETTAGPITVKTDYFSTDFMIDFEGATYFNKGKHQMGVGYSFGFSIPMTQSLNGKEVSVEGLPTGIIPSISFQYRYVMDKNLYIEAGSGINFDIRNTSTDYSSFTTTTFGLIANGGIQYRFNDLIGLRAGVEMGLPISASVKGTINNVVNGNSESESVFGKFILTPFVGVTLFY